MSQYMRRGHGIIALTRSGDWWLLSLPADAKLLVPIIVEMIIEVCAVLHARPVGRIRAVACPLPGRFLRIGAKWTRESGRAAGIDARGQDRIWRRPILDPVLQRSKCVEGCWTRASTAVTHARDQEQSRRLFELAHGMPVIGVSMPLFRVLDEIAIVIDRTTRGDQWVGLTMIYEQLVPFRDEGIEVGINMIDVRKFVVGKLRRGGGIDRTEV